MIPVRLSVSGFLSYCEPAEVDFTSFDLACISGPNGAGKSSLLDAITWVLFGQARKRDDSVINQRCSTADVGLIFAYEGNIYHVRRLKPRDKTMVLEFQILQSPEDGSEPSELKERIAHGQWKPLTERTLRDTETQIQKMLRMDYETFINASFFLQGKADQFTQQRPGDRKRILGSILGLEIWESYRQRASEKRHEVESSITGLDGQLHEITEELRQEAGRRERLKKLEEDLDRMSMMRQSQEAIAGQARSEAARIQEAQKLLNTISRNYETSLNRYKQSLSRLEERLSEQENYRAILDRSEEIEAAYAGWLATREALEQLDRLAEKYREIERQLEAPRSQIQAERARLEQELSGLVREKDLVEGAEADLAQINPDLETVKNELDLEEAKLDRRADLELSRQNKRQEQAETQAANNRLKQEMEELKDRINRLSISTEAECPLCGQPLSLVDRDALLQQLEAQGKNLAEEYRNNQAKLQQIDLEVRDLDTQIAGLSRVEAEIRKHTARIAQLSTRVETLEKQAADWQSRGAIRLNLLEKCLAEEDYATDARQRLKEIDSALVKTGYDPATHDAARIAGQTGRESEALLRELEKARAALEPLEREIADLSKQKIEQEAENQSHKQAYDQAANALAEAQSQALDLAETERRLQELIEQENRLRMNLGSAQQEVAVLEVQKSRKKALAAEREGLAHQVLLYKQLERAFGKDGVPALLIEQALPEIESKANETLARLSNGMMSVQFVTQTKYKDKTRNDLKETLDIRISDGAGTRDYEMFSGGEAFRVNFAIRLALSEVLAQRAGARLQTLVIDEGFGSQDAQGRQRLIEAINLVRNDFAKILVITHIDELKDQFPNRIEVEKSDAGSVIKVV